MPLPHFTLLRLPLFPLFFCSLLSLPVKAEIPSYIRDCMDCHGENGVSQHSDVPSIAGLSAPYHEASILKTP